MRRDKAVKADGNQQAVPKAGAGAGPDGNTVCGSESASYASAMDGRYLAMVSCTRWYPLCGYCAGMVADTWPAMLWRVHSLSRERRETKAKRSVICERCNKGWLREEGRKGRDYMRVQEEIDRDGRDARVDSVMRRMRIGMREDVKDRYAWFRECGQLLPATESASQCTF